MAVLTRLASAAAPVRQAVTFLALVKVVAGLLAVAVAPGATDATTPFPLEVFLLHMLVFSAAGAWLTVGGREDDRAQDLGVIYLALATMFADRPLELSAAQLANGASPWLAALRTLTLSAFVPWFVWRFALEFPRDVTPGRLRTAAAGAVGAAALLGVLAFARSVAGGLVIVSTGVQADPPWLRVLGPHDSAPYWVVWILFLLGAVALAVRNTRLASTDERRRVRLFAAGLLIGFVPMPLDVLLEFTIPPFGRLMNQPEMRVLSGWILYPLFLSTPLTTGYAVLVHEALSVRLVIRRAIRYALARATLLGVMGVPLVLLAWFLYENRTTPVATLVQGPRPFVLAGLVGAMSVLLAVRKRIMNEVDRRFFREQYDARQILGGLIDRSRSASTVTGLQDLLAKEIDRGLHVDGVSLLLLDEARRQLVPVGGLGRPLPAASALAVLLRGSPDPLDVGLDEPRATLQRLPEDERRWLADCGFRLLVPISGAQGSGLAGAIGLGAKRSELPFSAEDRWLLTAIAGSSSVVLDNLRLRTPRADVSPSAAVDGVHGHPQESLAAAGECPRCLLVQAGGDGPCPTCGAPLERAPLPHLLRGTFRVDRRLGAGGMGVVYLAMDLNLGRRVAIKTLPAVSPEHAHRLRREARAMGALHHEHLATIFGLEFWDGRPLLVVEYFEAGMLHERLHEGPLPLRAALEIGIGLARALEQVHGAGILHRDIKPSNIGFTGSGTAKLLDFGLAKFASQAAARPEAESGTDPQSTTQSGRRLWEASVAGRMIGTPLYFSPETVAMKPADEAVDLWALAMVLYESLAGRHPMRSASMSETFTRIAHAEVPDLVTLRPECPSQLAAFFRTALHRNRRQRPSHALDFRQQLERIAALP